MTTYEELQQRARNKGFGYALTASPTGGYWVSLPNYRGSPQWLSSLKEVEHYLARTHLAPFRIGQRVSPLTAERWKTGKITRVRTVKDGESEYDVETDRGQAHHFHSEITRKQRKGIYW